MDNRNYDVNRSGGAPLMFGRYSARFNNITMAQAREALERDPSIILIDVRSREEYASGHIMGSINIPVDEADAIVDIIDDKDAKIFVYSKSGARSRRACAEFSRKGYTDVTNIGGIRSWTGFTVR